MNDPVPPEASDLAVQIRRLSKLLEKIVPRLEAAERTVELTLFIQDELWEHIERLLDHVAEQRKQAQALFLKADVLGNSTEHEEYRLS
ncbi:MAG TPA: hypothetical protein VJR27_05930 [Candidatus Saccharimonadales bacterium]|nr:hypothetical protein [Candidatus Saccharimonadales bacterium]